MKKIGLKTIGFGSLMMALLCIKSVGQNRLDTLKVNAKYPHFVNNKYICKEIVHIKDDKRFNDDSLRIQLYDKFLPNKLGGYNPAYHDLKKYRRLEIHDSKISFPHEDSVSVFIVFEKNDSKMISLKLLGLGNIEGREFYFSHEVLKPTLINHLVRQILNQHISK